jgi:alginate O-acetyltransferase complex protein AlgI
VTVLQIAALAVVAAGIGRLAAGRQLAILGVSALAVYWLQPAQSPPSLQFWIPTATLGISVLVWALTAPLEARGWKQNWPAALVLAAVILLADLNRYFKFDSIYLVDTPRLRYVLAGVVAIFAIALLLAYRRHPASTLYILAFAGIVLILIVLKTAFVSAAVLDLLRRSTGAAAAPAHAASPSLLPTIGIQWLGYSYLAFRLMHTLLDRRSGRLPALTLSEFAGYVLFFPAFTAGPIDRAERFVRELRSPLPMPGDAWVQAGGRILVGLFKKFVIADTLAVISISEGLAPHVRTWGWLWLFLYAYAFRLFLDFSGYTDVAIGMGRLMGVQLPENFTAPYLKPNLTLFWNSWHITLTQWFRSYFFNPVVRLLRTSTRWLPAWVVILAAQIGTMVLIGLWHGVAWSFATWGLWHGAGLFIHNRWVALTTNRMPAWAQSSPGERVLRFAGVLLTFNFVAVGWLFFSFSSPVAAWHTLLRLFGAA